MKKVLSSEYRVPSLGQKSLILIIGLSCVLTACNLQQTPLNPTPTLQPTPTALTQSTEQPTRTPIGQPTAQSTLVAPPLPNLITPTALPLGANATPGSGTIIPTVSTQQAVQSTTIQVAAGKTVGLTYTVTMTSGSLTLTMQGPDGAVWQKTFTASETNRIEVVVKQGGEYAVMAQTDRFEGHYELSWN